MQALDPLALIRQTFSEREAFLAAKEKITNTDIPLVPPGQFTTGVTYPSAKEGKPEWHLPHYILHRQNDRWSTNLTLNRATSDPGAPIGSLSIDLQSLPPPAGHATSRAIPHTLALRLGFHVPVVGDPATDSPAPRPEGAAEFAGDWENLDPDTIGIVKLEIAPNGPDDLIVVAHENCPPKRCIVGKELAQFVDGKAMVSFRSEAKTVSLHLSREGDHLVVSEHVDIHDPQSPGDYLTTHIFMLKRAIRDLPIIWMDLGTPDPVTGNVRRSVTQIPDHQTYARILSVMTDPVHAARLELTCSATVGQRIMRQVFVGNLRTADFVAETGKKSFEMDQIVAATIRNQLAAAVLNNPADLNSFSTIFEVHKPATLPPPTPPPPPPHRGDLGSILIGGLVSGLLRGNSSGTTSDFRSSSRSEVSARSSHMSSASREAISSRNRARVDAAERFRMARDAAGTGNAARAALPATNAAATLKIEQVAKESLIDRKLPRHTLVEPTGEPVLTRRGDSAVQIVAPFTFDLQRHAYMFDMPPENAQGLVLLRHEVSTGGRTASFFQEGLDSKLYYYEPEEFRLARDDNAPFAPSMLFHLSEVVDPEADEGEGIAFEVTLTYRAVPYINPSLLTQARAEFGPDARFAPISPTINSLTISLPGESGAADIVLRDEAEVDFSNGISDMINLTEDQYLQFTRALQTASGIGLEGHVEAVLMDGTIASVPVRVGLRDSAEFAFDHAVDSVDANTARVTLRNRIESPVRIDHIHDVALPDGASAAPTQLASADPIEPGATTNVDFALNPPGTPSASLDPQFDASVLPDFLAILSQTTITQGYSDRDFSIDVSIDPAFFASAASDLGPLTAIEIAFRTLEEPVLLTAAQPSQTVTLPMPLLLFITNASDAQHYSYQITDIHGGERGEATAYTAGSGNLEVTPVAGANPFGGGFG
ncbi:hypothetical protein GRI41_08415 [Altererythrobacter aquaemixtae]|uniref:Uncharacterized protein n=1 Tax=Pontixanthobacter aquaemixtae TaxID=1958940 RepID=A0A844ZR91_9SPHN|nr:hypothetical protein [Pontixanthobacter aquaemixtae]